MLRAISSEENNPLAYTQAKHARHLPRHLNGKLEHRLPQQLRRNEKAVRHQR
jgi:hypothetical protein